MSLREAALVVESDSLLVVAGGFEDRARAIVDLLVPGTTLFAAAIVLQFSSSPEEDDRLARELADSVAPVCEVEPTLVVVDVDSPIESVFRITAAIESLVVGHRLRGATIDISGMTQMFGVGVIDGCVSAGLLDTVFYAEAQRYFPLKEDASKIEAEAKEFGTYDYWELLQSEGLQSVHIHPRFGGSLRINTPVALAVFVGFEPSRVRGLLDEYAPASVIAMVGQSPHPSFSWRSGLSRRLHEPFLTRWPFREVDISTLHVADIFAELESIYLSLGSEYDLAIALQCGKAQMLACYWFWRAHPEVQLVFTCPIAFNRSRYSIGIGPRHLFVREGAGVEALFSD